jgi:hypothetical protein
MPIARLTKDSAFAPEEIRLMTAAFEAAPDERSETSHPPSSLQRTTAVAWRAVGRQTLSDDRL